MSLWLVAITNKVLNKIIRWKRKFDDYKLSNLKKGGGYVCKG